MTTRLSLAAALLVLPACLEEQEFNEHPAAVPQTQPPCDGADLLHDDLNCGACGNECAVLWAGTDYAAGGCVEGECSPRWSGEFNMPSPPFALTCEEVCSFSQSECVPEGCSGLTGYVCIEIWDFEGECDLSIPDHRPTVELTGDCDAIPPYLEEFGEFGYFHRYLNCCCK